MSRYVPKRIPTKSITRRKSKLTLLAASGCAILLLVFCAMHTGPKQDSAPTVFPISPLTEESLELAVSTVKENSEAKELWGRCRITAYCACESCCGKWALDRPVDPKTGEPIVYGAAGEPLESLYSVAAWLPFGTELYIPELDMYFKVQDRTAEYIRERYDDMVVDIYVEGHEECLEFISTKNAYMDVYIVKTEE